MAQAFVTTYRNHYRWHKEPIRKAKKPVDRHAASAPPGDYWIDASVQKQQEELNIPYAKALVNQSRGRVLFSTYENSYCEDKVRAKRRELREAVRRAVGEVGVEEEEQSFENELLRYCEGLYKKKKSAKLLPPTETARRVYGFLRPESMYTPLTHYQMVYGRAGYDIMSNPTQYLDKRRRKNIQNEFPLCESIDFTEKSSFKRCEEMRKAREMKEKKDRQLKLDNILQNLDRCSNHVVNPDSVICPCDFQMENLNSSRY